MNAFVETSVPSIVIFLVAREINPVYVLQSASSLLYAVFIVLSTLRLDFRLSVFTGVVAAGSRTAYYTLRPWNRATLPIGRPTCRVRCARRA